MGEVLFDVLVCGPVVFQCGAVVFMSEEFFDEFDVAHVVFAVFVKSECCAGASDGVGCDVCGDACEPGDVMQPVADGVDVLVSCSFLFAVVFEEQVVFMSGLWLWSYL